MLELDGDVPFQHAQASQLTKQLDEAEPSLNTAELLREIIRFRGLAAEWAHLAAPYVHPRLAAVAHRHTNADGRPVQPVVNVYIHGNPRPEGAGPLSEPGDNIPDRRHFDDLVGERHGWGDESDAIFRFAGDRAAPAVVSIRRVL
jgi:hypothetical protein